MTSDWIYYFGYGSLVNRDTRPTVEFSKRARLNGWQRAWEHRTSDPERTQQCTSLSIERLQPDVSEGGIDGVIARMKASDLAILDERESGYERMNIPATQFVLPDEISPQSVYVYRSLPQNRHAATENHPILQSYIDCVLAGYHHQFGESGMLAMIASTRGWNTPIMDDRADPHYPRWVSVTTAMQQAFDREVARAGA